MQDCGLCSSSREWDMGVLRPARYVVVGACAKLLQAHNPAGLHKSKQHWRKNCSSFVCPLYNSGTSE